jgi:hypothetical protein
MTRPKLIPSKSLAVIVALRLTPNENDLFRKVAKRQGKTFAAWARETMNAAAKGK